MYRCGGVAMYHAGKRGYSGGGLVRRLSAGPDILLHDPDRVETRAVAGMEV